LAGVCFSGVLEGPVWTSIFATVLYTFMGGEDFPEDPVLPAREARAHNPLRQISPLRTQSDVALRCEIVQRMKVTLIHNPSAGDDAQPGAEALMTLMRAAGHQVAYRSSRDADWTVALEDPGDLVAIAGGDGTVADVAKRMIGRGVPLALVPMGTANNIGRSLGMAEVPLEQQVIGWQSARRTTFDVGVASGPWGTRYFLEGVGLGLFAQILAETEANATLAALHRADAKIAYALQMLKESVQLCPSVSVSATLDGQDLSGNYVLFEAMNAQYVGPNLYLAPHGHPGDGAFDVVLATESERDRLERCLANWQNGGMHHPELPSYRGRELRIRWSGYPLHIDDVLEPEQTLGLDLFEAKVTMASNALEFLLPA
jgi:diacylglycerol kinase family enzyme